MRPFVIATLLALAACAPAASTPDAGHAPDGSGGGVPAHDAGDPESPDAAIDAGNALDAGDPADAGEAPDASFAADAGTADAGAFDAGWFEVHTSRPYWKLAFEDDFRGKTGAPDDAYCFDQLEPQCTIWPGGNTNDCDLGDVNGELIGPTRANLAAAIRTMDAAASLDGLSEADVKARYGQLIRTRLASLNKCTWTLYQMVNWMATDYAGHWSARFDASQVSVDPAGKGYLALTAQSAPVQYDCIYGGENFGGPNCLVHGFQAGEVRAGVTYTVDANPQWPGVYYAQVNGACPYGGTAFGPNCRVWSAPAWTLDEHGPAYWVDADPRWPGVYYANQTYRCRDNIDYPNGGVHFRNLTCPVLDGGVLSMTAENRAVPGTGRVRGKTQKYGRFEVKARIPKGLGAFPAAWMMPVSGGWPYKGGEIDILEARDAANETYQTYHHGRCVDATGRHLDADGPPPCAQLGGINVQLSKGLTIKERVPDEFWKRDHLYSVEWDESGLRYFVNDVFTHDVRVGSVASPDSPNPPGGVVLDSENMADRAFYWILNHSTYVAPGALAGWAPQKFLIDYVKSYDRCRYNADFCPCGGTFVEGTGCVWQGGARLSCPPGVTLPPMSGDVYAPFCEPAERKCVNGGTWTGSRCEIYNFAAGVVRPGVSYWVDADPRWPGVFYAKVNGACPYGGAGPVNCQVLSLDLALVESGIDYRLDLTPSHQVIYYLPDFAP